MSYEEFYRVYLPDLKGSGVQKRTVCPFCEHTDDLSINMATGQCKCFYGGCGFEGDVFDLLMKKENLTFSEAARKLERWGIKPLRERKYSETEEECNSSPTHPVTHEEMKKDAERFADTLRDDLRVFLREGRGLSSEVITRYRIGFAKEHPNYPARDRLSIPILKNGEYCNIRFHSLKDEKPKDLPYREGLPYATWIFPEDQLENNEIWLCEGELDALCAISHGLPAVSVTGGAGSWKNEFTPLFKGKQVHIVYDCDEAGRKGGEKIAGILSKIAQVKIIDLGLRQGEDLTNWFADYGKSKKEPEQLAKRTPIFESLTKREQRIRDSALKLASKSLSVKKLFETKLPEEEFLIGGGLMPKGGYVLLAGLTKEGKTILALQMALNLISATSFLNRFPVKKKAKVLYLYAENTLNGLNNILQKQTAALRYNGYKISDDDLDNFVLQEAKGLFLDTSQGSKCLDELAKFHGPEVIFIDPLSLFTIGNIDRLENATKMVRCLNKIASERDCSWVLIHHYRKPSKEDIGEPIYKVIGSSGFGNFCETFIGLERSHKQRSSNFKTLHFRLRREDTPEPICFYRDPETLVCEPKEAEELTRGVSVGDVVRILKQELKGKSAYTPLVSTASLKFGVTKTRIAELLKEAQDSGFLAKEPGKFGSYYAL